MIAALLYGNDLHHLDHLAPLCSLLEIPLIVCDDNIFDLAKKFYPKLNLIYLETTKISTYFLDNVKYMISCLTKPYLKLIFFPYEADLKKKILPIWCPHGNSDKGLKTDYFNPLKNESCLLVYGMKMFDILKQKNLLTSNLKIIQIGNYRRTYYNLHYNEYQTLIKDEFVKLKNQNNKYLYAPTWEDSENNSSVPLYLKNITKTIKENEHLFIKLHPNTLKKDDFYLHKIFWELEHNDQVTLIENFPLIYPLLDNIDLFLGDFSSIGYDVLSFKKPMGFLLPPNKKTQDSNLFQCGVNFSNFQDNKNHLSDLLESPHKFEEEKAKLYNYTYARNPNWKNELFKLCQ
jgi:teichoic acid glycerol-phosphate primase